MATDRWIVVDQDGNWVGGPYRWDGQSTWIAPEIESNPDNRLVEDSSVEGQAALDRYWDEVRPQPDEVDSSKSNENIVNGL